MRTNPAGVAICSCGAELEIRCTGGCAVPDFVSKREHDTNAICNWVGCNEPVGESPSGHYVRRCTKHRALQRSYGLRHLAKKKAAG
ncbi:MAG: hypothetical protein M3P26_04505 [Gemmatimonadota bacterium]|nr:hypothetical protein [Gemmatimonadota bacterium]